MLVLNLSTLAIVLGLALGLPQVYGLINPSGFGAALRGFPRSVPFGYVLMLLGTAWFVYNLSQESISDFAAYKNILFAGFAAVGLGSCIYVKDFLAVRGLAVVFLLLAKLMVDTGRPHLAQTSLVLIIQTSAYVLVVLGIWLTVAPWRLRDFFQWATVSNKRLKMVCGVPLVFGLLLAILGFTKF